MLLTYFTLVLFVIFLIIFMFAFLAYEVIGHQVCYYSSQTDQVAFLRHIQCILLFPYNKYLIRTSNLRIYQQPHSVSIGDLLFQRQLCTGGTPQGNKHVTFSWSYAEPVLAPFGSCGSKGCQGRKLFFHPDVPVYRDFRNGENLSAIVFAHFL